MTLEKGSFACLEKHGGNVVKVWLGREPRRKGEKSCE
jgi:hypothetical protein